MGEAWTEVADRVFVRRHRSMDLNVTLVVGEGACLVVDTRADLIQGRELAEAVRAVTRHPWVVVNTHFHFDHAFGNAAFRPASIWGHRRCAEVLSGADGERMRTRIAGLYREAGHTDSDLVVLVPDAAVLLAGDLIEEGAPPQFGDGFPLDWPGTLDAMLDLVTGPVVPGHGAVVDKAFVEAQRVELGRLAEVARAAHAAGRPAADAAHDLPYFGEYAEQAVARAYLQLQ